MSVHGSASNGTLDHDAIFGTPGLVEAAVNRAVRQALRRHKRLGESIAVWRDGQVAIVPPEEIAVPDEPADVGPCASS